jgi:phage-related protein
MREVARAGLRAARHLRGPLYEVRVDAAARSYRVVFAAEGKKGRVLLALAVFAKRTARTPKRELKVALQRLADWRSHG